MKVCFNNFLNFVGKVRKNRSGSQVYEKSMRKCLLAARLPQRIAAIDHQEGTGHIAGSITGQVDS